ncbi:ribosome-recycling factor [Elysia marginata]|uniref:Ribosome-recycling factor n=1 Tax=Elysia marginata TaxID=1093978 RepID=A0AAV4GN83_9GAST|nr:ribosome-recycling factor [Elysia marginata]
MNDVNHVWHQVKTSYQETGKTTLCCKEKKLKEWISKKCAKDKERKNIKKKILAPKSGRLEEQYQQTDREADPAVKQLVKRDKRKHLEDMAAQAEEAAHKEDRRTLYKIT